MRRSLNSSVAASALLGVLGLTGAALESAPAAASPIPYYNSPLDTPQAAVNSAIGSVNGAVPELQYQSSCSGNTTMTCTGDRIIASVTNLTTAGNLTGSAQITVTDTSVAAADDVFCTVDGYAGNGTAMVANITANAGNLTFYIQNTSNPAVNLSATVPVHCLIVAP